MMACILYQYLLGLDAFPSWLELDQGFLWEMKPLMWNTEPQLKTHSCGCRQRATSAIHPHGVQLVVSSCLLQLKLYLGFPNFHCSLHLAICSLWQQDRKKHQFDMFNFSSALMFSNFHFFKNFQGEDVKDKSVPNPYSVVHFYQLQHDQLFTHLVSSKLPDDNFV